MSDPSQAPARWRAFTALAALERGKVGRVREALRVDDLPARERGLALELSVGVERRRITLDALLVALTTRGQLTTDTFVRTALRIGAYQLLYLPRMPAHAAVHTAVELLQAQRSFANALLRGLTRRIVLRAADPSRPRAEFELPATDDAPRAVVFDHDALPDPHATPAEYLSVVHGVPADLLARWLEAYGLERTKAIAHASASVPGVSLRVQRARTEVALLQASLREEGIATRAGAEAGFLFLQHVEAGSPFTTRAHREGLFTAQDPTAAAAAQALDAQPGETILDLCAAPGGKTAVIAEALLGRGKVFAYDIDGERLQRVREITQRMQLGAVVTVVSDLASVPAECDAVLADVPCSNTGVLSRRVEVRRRPIRDSLAALVPAQIGLLRVALARVRPGGRVVYSTCSLEAEENRGVVDAALRSCPDAQVQREQLTLPQAGAHDGGYFAVIVRRPAIG